VLTCRRSVLQAVYNTLQIFTKECFA
jgi:hypothetical protein